MLPIMMSQRLSYFNFKDCHFKMEKAKESTARMVVYKELGINNSYTMETSAFGPAGNPDIQHFSFTQFSDLGKNLWLASLGFAFPGVFTKKLIWATNYLRKIQKQKTFISHYERLASSRKDGSTTPVKSNFSKSIPLSVPNEFV